MKYEVFYNMMGVLPVHNYFATLEEAKAFQQRAINKGFDAKIIEQ